MRKLYLGIFCFLLVGLQSAKSNSMEGRYFDPLDGDLIEQIIKSIPNPIEITALMKESGVAYDRNRLNNYVNSSKYTTNFKKALNLGVYSTDLGFANMYGKTQDAIHYLDAVQDLSEGLAIDQFFEYSTLKSLAEKENLSQLIQTTIRNFEKINNHLHDQKRDVISALLLTGGWIESTYLTVEVYQKSASKPQVKKLLKEKIGEQKLVIDRLMLLLDIYSSKPQVPQLIASLRKVQDIYDDVELGESKGEVRVVENSDGTITFEEVGEGYVKITDAQVKQITTLITQIRKDITQ